MSVKFVKAVLVLEPQCFAIRTIL